MSIERLPQLLPPPTNPTGSGNHGDWEAVEAGLTPLPRDYKEFVDTYGLGRIDGFVLIYSPFAQSPSANLLARGRQDLAALTELRNKYGKSEVPYALFPEQGGLLPFGTDDNGDGLYWLTEGDPDEWAVVVNEGRAPEYERFDMPMTGFLALILSKTIKCGIFPADFPDPRPAFSPLEDCEDRA
jgi:hypothetical protein